MVMFGTKRPSMTSTWIQSAPAASTARTSSPRRAKSAESTEGAIRMRGMRLLRAGRRAVGEPHELARRAQQCRRNLARAGADFGQNRGLLAAGDEEGDLPAALEH